MSTTSSILVAAAIVALGCDAGLEPGGPDADVDAGLAPDLDADPVGPSRPPAPVDQLDAPAAPGCPAARGGDHFEFLDDVCGVKRRPSRLERGAACPVTATSTSPTLADGRRVDYRPATAGVTVDDAALAGLVSPDLDVTMILVRRVDGVPHYRYLSNGSHAATFQPWSATKFMAIANAAAALRVRSGYRVGLTASAGNVPLGDLVTVVHDYDERAYSSNGLARYFHDIGGRAEAQALITDWLGRPPHETFGGNYGSPAPALGYTFTEPTGASVTLVPDLASGRTNHLSTFTLAEFLKRLVMHREDSTTRLPGIQWADVETLLYGAREATAHGGWGGMSADPSIYVQAGVPIDVIERRSRGTWRTFGKLGLGDGEFVHVDYACLPVLDDRGAVVPDVGKEVFIATRLAAGGATWADRDALLASAYATLLARVVDGRLK